jgi:transposase InsO family protein
VFRSKAFIAARQALGLEHKFIRAYRPQTNGKAERFIQSALREWAYGIAYDHSNERAEMLERDSPLQLASCSPRHPKLHPP